MKLQSPNYDAAGAGYEIALPVTQDSYNGNSMASILALFDGINKIMDFGQLSETITLTGILTVQAAKDAGFVDGSGNGNPVQMRDELRRIRLHAGDYGKNTGAAQAWIEEDGTASGGVWTSAALVAAGEDDAGTSRRLGLCRIVWDQYYKPSTGTFKKLFAYGTVSAINFGPRPAATTQTRIPFSVTMLIGQPQHG